MKTRGAVITEQPGKFEVVDIDLEEPRQAEITVELVASGLCHSDDHLRTGDFPVPTLPMCGGHEGAGRVVEVGPHTSGFEVGDHVILSCLPGCGRCRWCATGHQNLCDLNANLVVGSRWEDPTSFRMSIDGEPVGQFVGISTFSELTTVSTLSAVKIPKDVPLETACLIGCGVNTGWGAAVNSGQVKPGDTVIVMGCGGVGNFAVQGASHAGALYVIACDPLENKREKALEVGATHAAASIDEATELARGMTNGQGADVTVITVGVLKPEYVTAALASVSKMGTVVTVGLGRATDVDFQISIFELTLSQKRLQGSMFGAVTPSWDILKMVNVYAGGRLKLDEVVSQTYTLDQVNEGYDDMLAGLNVRGVIHF